MGEEIVIDNRFVLGQKIGAGSFGEIYRATDLKTGELVAAKLVWLNFINDLCSH
jgi:casein kinase 1